MRTAYNGRAAAYEKMGDYGKALADHNLVVLFYAIEIDILNNLETPDRDKLWLEAAEAYRVRGKCLEVLGRQKAAAADREKADGLVAAANKLTSQAAQKKEAAAKQVRVVNAWTDAVTLVVDGVSYRLEVGEKRMIPVYSATVSYDMKTGTFRASGLLEAGKTYTIQAPSR
jgi:tetratricopeptide (TPR) repeat protein